MRTAYHERLAVLAPELADACGMAGQAMSLATDALLRADLDPADLVIAARPDIAGRTRRAQRRAFALLALQAPVASDLRAVVTAMQIAGDVERMGGLAAHVAEAARRRHPEGVVPAQVSPLFADMGRLAVELAGGAREALLSRDPRRAARIGDDDDAMDDVHRRLLYAMSDRDWTYGVCAAVDLALVGRFYERFADHAVRIGQLVVFQATGYHWSVDDAGF